MRVEHSALLNGFISFWFETKVDGILNYETVLDFSSRHWYVRSPDQNAILLEGQWQEGLADDQVVTHVAPLVESAIKSGRLSDTTQ
jgi:hypothetical protein